MVAGLRRQAFTIIEVLVAAALLLFATLSFLTIYSTTVRYQIHSQNRSLASHLGENLLDEVAAHAFGEPAPTDWGIPAGKLQGQWQTQPMLIWIEGRKVECEFHLQFRCKNGSCLGLAPQDWDVVTVMISWSEGVSTRSDRDGLSDGYYQNDNMHLVVQIPVWR